MNRMRVGAALLASAAGIAVLGTAASAQAATPDKVDVWVDQALVVMHKHHIPGSHEAIRSTIMRESSGNPHAVNHADSNARSGNASEGLMQITPTTFAHYHVSGTSGNIQDPIANISAATNYAFHRYGTIENVHGAY
jgi:SLT domain-containing protein